MYKYIFYLSVITVIGFIYEKYKNKNMRDDNDRKNELIRKYLLGNNVYDMNIFKKKNIWIYLDFEPNTRNWLSFGSRKTEKLNQPYKLLCLQSIINNAKEDYNICILDDNSFGKLLPNWNINLKSIASPIKSHIVTLGLYKILYEYGGILCPSSFLSLKPIYELDRMGNSGTYIFEGINRNITSEYSKFIPNNRFIGCEKNSGVIGNLVNYLENLNSTDYTDESDFLGSFDRKCYEYVINNKIKLIDGKYIGIKDKKCNTVLVDSLLENSYINYDENLHGILIPDKEVLKRFKYSWFARLNINEVLSSNTILSKYFVLSRYN
jgi:hypothetical protein